MEFAVTATEWNRASFREKIVIRKSLRPGAKDSRYAEVCLV